MGTLMQRDLRKLEDQDAEPDDDCVERRLR